MKAGITIAVCLIAFIAIPLIGLLASSDLLSDKSVTISELWHSAYYRRVVQFSIWQASLSTFLSVGCRWGKISTALLAFF